MFEDDGSIIGPQLTQVGVAVSGCILHLSSAMLPYLEGFKVVVHVALIL